MRPSSSKPKMFGKIKTLDELRIARRMLDSQAEQKRAQLSEDWQALQTIFTIEYQIDRAANRVEQFTARVGDWVSGFVNSGNLVRQIIAKVRSRGFDRGAADEGEKHESTDTADRNTADNSQQKVASTPDADCPTREQ